MSIFENDEKKGWCIKKTAVEKICLTFSNIENIIEL